MSRKKTFVKELTELEISNLEEGYKYGPSPDFRNRCQMILLSYRGFEVKAITSALGVCAHTVYANIKGWKTHGLPSLIRRPGQGRKPTLRADNEQHVQATRKAVKKYPQDSSQILRELEEMLDIEPIHECTLRRFLKKWATSGSASADG